jgi:ATP-dependent DNA helicase RecQ
VPDLDGVARSVLGFDLRPPQRESAAAVAEGRDTLAVLPTGSGKSAIYQVAGLVRGGLTIVVSPLLALQRDQVRSLTGRGIAATVLNSGMHRAERDAALTALHDGSLDFVLLGPEQLANDESLGAITGGGRPVTLVTVDEAHLVSQWGHDFRPDYLRLADVIDAVGRPPVLALTATASPPVQADITRQLRMSAPKVLVAGFDRPNLSLTVRRTRQDLPEDQALDDRTVEVMLSQETPALVYALTRARCEELADRLRHDAYRVRAYHAGLSAAERSEVQDAFFAGELDIVVATSAFGMGIDKPDVRTVVHAGMPGSLDEYYQEIGRAGRDGKPGAAVLVHDMRTVRIPRLLAARSRMPAETVDAVIDQLERTRGRATVAVLVGAALPPEAEAAVLAEGDRHQKILASQIDTARHYADTPHCRRAELLAYFGEDFAPPCGNCDNDASGATVPPPAAHHEGDVHVHHKLWGPGILLSRDEHELTAVFDTVGYRHLTPAALTNGLLTLD